MKGASFRIKKMWIKQLCNQKIWDFATAYRVRKYFGTFTGSGARFSKVPETFRAARCTRLKLLVWREPLHIKNMWMKQLCNHKVWVFAMAFRVWKLFGTFEKRALGNNIYSPKLKSSLANELNSAVKPDLRNKKPLNEPLSAVPSQKEPYINREVVVKKLTCYLQKVASLLKRGVVTFR